MNPQRYLMPVVIAAGLHGALVYFFSDKYPPPPTTDKIVAAPLPPLPPIQMIEQTADPGEPGAGNAEPLPSQPDIERPASKEDIFTINVTPSAEPLRPVTTLPENPTRWTGPGGVIDGVGRPQPPDVAKLDRIPRATVRHSPVYPPALRALGGSVTVLFVVDSTGRVISAEAVKWTRREFVDPAVAAVLRWRFEPGTINSVPVNFRMAISIEFQPEP